MGKKIVVNVTEVGVPIEVRVGYLLIGIGGVKIALAILLLGTLVSENDPSTGLLICLVAIGGIIYQCIIGWIGITLCEKDYKVGEHKKDLGWMIIYHIIFGLSLSTRIFTGELNIAVPAVIGLILTLIGALLVYSK
jgi:hypothetical protein